MHFALEMDRLLCGGGFYFALIYPNYLFQFDKTFILIMYEKKSKRAEKPKPEGAGSE